MPKAKSKQLSNRALIDKLYFILTDDKKWESRFIMRLHDLKDKEYILSADEERALHSILHKYRDNPNLVYKDEPIHVCDERCAAYETEKADKAIAKPLFDVKLFRGEVSYMTKETNVTLKGV